MAIKMSLGSSSRRGLRRLTIPGTISESTGASKEESLRLDQRGCRVRLGPAVVLVEKHHFVPPVEFERRYRFDLPGLHADGARL